MRKNITVIAKMDENGKITPLSILWSPSLSIEIDKVVDIRKKASLKGGGMGIRYTCLIKNQQRYLWLDENIWFVEV
ncbi:MAG: hypothetical protein IKB06_00700 [Clostridia bacterium]|nr:hypothetical protein [Clostridia bacterium]